MSDYEKTYNRWIESTQKFDYYIVGVIGATLIILIRDLEIQEFGWNSEVMRAIGVFLLLVSFISGILRLERFHMLLRFEKEKIVLIEKRNRFSGGDISVLNEIDLSPLSSDEIQTLKERTEKDFIIIQKELRKAGGILNVSYNIRNLFFLLGLIVFFCAAFIDPLIAMSKEPAQQQSNRVSSAASLVWSQVSCR